MPEVPPQEGFQQINTQPPNYFQPEVQKPDIKPQEAAKSKFNWKKTLLPIFIGATIIFAGLAGFYYWQLNKTKEPSEVTPSKTATPSAKQATPSAEEESKKESQSTDETADWKKFTSNSIGYSVKIPNTWLTKEGAKDSLCGSGVDFIAPTTETLGKCATEFGGLIVIQKINKAFTSYTASLDTTNLKNSTKTNTTVGGKEAVKVMGTYNTTNDMYSLNGSEVIDYYINQNGKVLMIEYLGRPSWTDHSETFEQIVETFSFL